MDLKLHQSGKTSSSKTPVKKLGRLGGKDSEQIDKWIRDVRVSGIILFLR